MLAITSATISLIILGCTVAGRGKEKEKERDDCKGETETERQTGHDFCATVTAKDRFLEKRSSEQVRSSETKRPLTFAEKHVLNVLRGFYGVTCARASVHIRNWNETGRARSQCGIKGWRINRTVNRDVSSSFHVPFFFRAQKFNLRFKHRNDTLPVYRPHPQSESSAFGIVDSLVSDAIRHVTNFIAC